MKIVRQLADWLLQNDRITPERYGHVMDAILGGADTTAGFLIEEAVDRRDRREAAEDAVEEWWNLRGAGVRARSKAARRPGGRRTSKATPIKVWDLDPRLPGMLFPPGAAPDAFPLATLLLAVDEARGSRRAAGWDGFAAAAAALYKAGGDEIHDALRAAMERRGRALGPLLAAMETGATLFPDGFLGGLSGESVTALRKRVDGGETAFSFVKKDWILRYPSFNVLNEACLVRNRLRRVYRLWVQAFSEWNEHSAANRCSTGVCLAFGKTLVHVPLAVWWHLQDPAAPRLGSRRGLTAFPARSGDFWLNIRVDGKPVVLYTNDCVDPPDPPCGFDFIWDDERLPWGLEERPSPVQLLYPVVEPGRRVPVLALPDAAETVLWTPDDWAEAVKEGRKLSNGVPAEDACPWRALCSCLWNDGWKDLLRGRPDVVRKIPWDRLDPAAIRAEPLTWLLSIRPECADRAPWNDLDSEQLVRVLSAQPVLAERFDCNAVDPGKLASLLEALPECAEPCLRRLTNGGRWATLLSRQPRPEWAAFCPWESFSGWLWRLLLGKQPQFADRCDWSKLDGKDWRFLLRDQPQFADRCDWGKLDDTDWRFLLCDQPQLAAYAPAKN